MLATAENVSVLGDYSRVLHFIVSKSIYLLCEYGLTLHIGPKRPQ